MARFFVPPGFQVFLNTGLPLVGGKLNFYVAATTTPQNVFSDSTLVTPITQPVLLDANGRPVAGGGSIIYMSPTTYRVQLLSAASVLIADWDNVDAGIALGSGALPIANGGTGATTAAGARSNLGLGTAATQNTGTSGATVPLLNGTNTWSGVQTFTATSIIYPGKIAQIQTTQLGTVASGATALPLDDTIPQITEGDEYITVTITPTNAASSLYIEAVLNLATLVAANYGVALFQDATANALAAWQGSGSAANSLTQAFCMHKMTAGTTSATTFRIRAGSGTTLTFNGVGGVRRFGGVMASQLRVVEVLN